MMKYFYKTLLFALLLSAFNTQAQYNHVLDGTLDATDEINIMHRRGGLQVLPSTDGKIKWEVRLSFDAKEKAEADKLIEALKVNAGTVGNRTDIQTKIDIKNMRTINGKSSIELKNGTKIKNVRNVRIDMRVYTPRVNMLKTDTRYETVEVKVDVTELLTVHTYDGKLAIGDISGRLDLNDKYSKGEVGASGDANLELYESKINFGKLGAVDINAKYSNIYIPGAKSISGQTYECKANIGDVDGKVVLNDKYSKFEVKTFKDAILDLYESEILSEEGRDLQIKSKYGELRIRKVNNLLFESSYEDDIYFQETNNLRVNDSKYSEYHLGKLTGALELKSYEDKIDVASPNASISGIQIEGKYTVLNCILPSSMAYQVDLNARYTNIDLEKDDLDFSTYYEKGDRLEIKGKKKGAGDNAPMLKFNCYECKLNLQ